MMSVMLLVLVVSNVNADVITMAHNAGFTNCDTAINEALSFYNKSDSGRINTAYFNDNTKTFSAMVTFGEQGDTVFQRVIFENDGSACYAYETSMITSKLSCIAYKEENPVWKFVATQGDFTWTQNGKGINALLKNQPSGCSIFYEQNVKYSLDTPQVVSKKKK
jgi:hypothetical protein